MSNVISAIIFNLRATVEEKNNNSNVGLFVN